MIIFTWDPKKNESNIEKHNISFEEARTVFYDEDALLSYDYNHSDDEDRFRLLGVSFYGKTLIVRHCSRNNDKTIRIFSARLATKQEEAQYYERKGKD